MKATKFLGLGAFGLLVIWAYAEQRHFEAGMQTAMSVTDPAAARMQPAPISADWLIEGHPTTMAAEISHTDDGTTKTFIWSTTKSRFRWLYDSDEVITVIDGEVFVDDGINGERHLGPGAVAFFPAGAKTTWRVPDHLRKIAVLKGPMPSPVASVIRWLKAVKHMVRPQNTGFAS